MFLVNKQFMENGRLVPVDGGDVEYHVEVGDVVICKSGSFPMTVREVIADSAGNLIAVGCLYFNPVNGEFALMKLFPSEMWLHIPSVPELPGG